MTRLITSFTLEFENEHTSVVPSGSIYGTQYPIMYLFLLALSPLVKHTSAHKGPLRRALVETLNDGTNTSLETEKKLKQIEEKS